MVQMQDDQGHQQGSSIDTADGDGHSVQAVGVSLGGGDTQHYRILPIDHRELYIEELYYYFLTVHMHRRNRCVLDSFRVRCVSVESLSKLHVNVVFPSYHRTNPGTLNGKSIA
jgi:hypothetical protein